MVYEKVLSGKHKDAIFSLFMDNYTLRFSDIEKKINLCSNKIAYHIKQLIQEGILEKQGGKYALSQEAEQYIPFFSNKERKILNPLPVVLIAAVHKNKILLVKRDRRPYKDHWCMLGGKILADETIDETALRILDKKASLKGRKPCLNHLIHERVLEKSTIKHSFLLFFMKVKCNSNNFKSNTGEELKWVEIGRLKSKNVVPSDYWLIKNKLDSRMDLMTFDMIDRKGKLVRKPSQSL